MPPKKGAPPPEPPPLPPEPPKDEPLEPDAFVPALCEELGAAEAEKVAAGLTRLQKMPPERRRARVVDDDAGDECVDCAPHRTRHAAGRALSVAWRAAGGAGTMTRSLAARPARYCCS